MFWFCFTFVITKIKGTRTPSLALPLRKIMYWCQKSENRQFAIFFFFGGKKEKKKVLKRKINEELVLDEENT